MGERYKSRLADLRREVQTEGARPWVIDTLVTELLVERDDRLANDLLSLLSDNARSDEGMFSLIHAAESFDDSEYVHALLAALPRLVSSAPRWASIVMMRVLNSESTRLEMVKELRQSQLSVRQAVLTVCDHVNKVSPQFSQKIAAVMRAMSE